jgi:hypothetical protein
MTRSRYVHKEDLCHSNGDINRLMMKNFISPIVLLLKSYLTLSVFFQLSNITTDLSRYSFMLRTTHRMLATLAGTCNLLFTPLLSKGILQTLTGDSMQVSCI